MENELMGSDSDLNDLLLLFVFVVKIKSSGFEPDDTY
jgi:hypothetical protein